MYSVSDGFIKDVVALWRSYNSMFIFAAGDVWRSPVKTVLQREVEIEPSVKLECVPKFCYLGDTLGAGGGADEAARARESKVRSCTVFWVSIEWRWLGVGCINVVEAWMRWAGRGQEDLERMCKGWYGWAWFAPWMGSVQGYVERPHIGKNV